MANCLWKYVIPEPLGLLQLCKKEKQVKEEKPESPEKPKETEKAKTVATGDGSYVKILVFLIGVILTGALLLCFLLSRMWGRMWKRR